MRGLHLLITLGLVSMVMPARADLNLEDFYSRVEVAKASAEAAAKQENTVARLKAQLTVALQAEETAFYHSVGRDIKANQELERVKSQVDALMQQLAEAETRMLFQQDLAAKAYAAVRDDLRNPQVVAQAWGAPGRPAPQVHSAPVVAAAVPQSATGSVDAATLAADARAEALKDRLAAAQARLKQLINGAIAAQTSDERGMIADEMRRTERELRRLSDEAQGSDEAPRQHRRVRFFESIGNAFRSLFAGIASPFGGHSSDRNWQLISDYRAARDAAKLAVADAKRDLNQSQKTMTVAERELTDLESQLTLLQTQQRDVQLHVRGLTELSFTVSSPSQRKALSQRLQAASRWLEQTKATVEQQMHRVAIARQTVQQRRQDMLSANERLQAAESNYDHAKQKLNDAKHGFSS